MRTFKISTFLFLFSFLFLSGCIVLDKYELKSTSIDLSEFDKQGIFVTTGDLFQNYKPVSIVVATCYQGYTPKSASMKKAELSSKKEQHFDDIYQSNSVQGGENPKNFNFKVCSLQDLFAEIIDQAKLKGANGIIKLEIKNVTRSGKLSKTTQEGYEIVGLAIKIEE